MKQVDNIINNLKSNEYFEKAIENCREWNLDTLTTFISQLLEFGFELEEGDYSEFNKLHIVQSFELGSAHFEKYKYTGDLAQNSFHSIAMCILPPSEHFEEPNIVIYYYSEAKIIKAIYHIDQVKSLYKAIEDIQEVSEYHYRCSNYRDEARILVS